MFSSAEKTNRINTVVQQKAQQQTFFRKAGEESFFGAKEQPHFFNAYAGTSKFRICRRRKKNR